jgi:hypothetical protein
MAWQRIDTVPLDLDSGVAAARAHAIADALTRRVVPLLRVIDGRAEPLASAVFFFADGRVLLLTCRHVFDDGAVLGDLGVPFGHSGRIGWLRSARARVLAQPGRDLALILIGDARFAAEALRHWRAVPLVAQAAARTERVFVVAGYPYVQMRRCQEVVFAKPLVLFARGELDEDKLHIEYRRTVRRIDGLEVHAPSLDGVSGAVCWAITDELDDGFGCVLQPAAVQVAFKHDAYARGEPLSQLELLTRSLQRG